MAGKRVLDAAKLFNAGGSVAKQHFVLRKEQWDVYSRTSTLAKAVKDQTERVTVTTGAAFELARRFNEGDPPWLKQYRPDGSQQPTHADAYETREGFNSTGLDGDAAWPSQGEAPVSERHGGPPNPVSTRSIGTAQEQDDGSLSSLRRREMQRLAERQIPMASAGAQSQPSEQDAGQDTFSERSRDVTPELSSLPRTKIPKHSRDTQTGEHGTAAKGINQDVFYTVSNGAAAAVDANELPEGMTLDGAFSSPQVSKMIGRTGAGTKNPYAGRPKLPPQPLPEMVVTEDRRRKEAQGEVSEITEVPDSKIDEETKKLTASIAEETVAQPSEAVGQSGTSQSYEMRESRVPSSRFGRLWQYGGLATSMAFGAVGESFRRLGGGGSGDGSLMLSEGNMNRLVAKLSRMRGAALKLGQMISFQDSKLLPPTIHEVLQRVQDSADYMPSSQRNQVLVQNLGQSWRDLFSDFDERPFAAASIGQVHKATLASNGKKVAVKVQYPGVRNSIDSDLNNLSLLLTASRLLPRGLYLEKTIANARVELGWECDYEREARACIRFRDLLKDESDTFTVPEIYTEASGPGVLTAEFMTGTAVTKMKELTQEDRDWVGSQILRLCLRELMEWHFMQTDPNWTNFLYNRETKKLELLDFGASRDFADEFVEPYVSLLMAAAKGDRDACRDRSIELGYLTGRESRAMLDAHVDSILTLAEPFAANAPEVYDFEDQTITERVRANIGLMLRERLAPPPEETYSLHRKLSGAFLLCARLESRVAARDMFRRAVEVREGGRGQM